MSISSLGNNDCTSLANTRSTLQKPGVAGSNDTKVEEQAKEQQVRKLRDREREVRAHESAHKAAGGPYAGAVSYTYTRGPDGKIYISGGEVSIDVSEEKTPEATIRKMEQIKAAALAPSDPSSQDQSVAVKAAMIAMKARQEVSRQQREEITAEDGPASQREAVNGQGENDAAIEIFASISVYA